MNAAERITNPLALQPAWMTRQDRRKEIGKLPILNGTFDGQKQSNILTDASWCLHLPGKRVSGAASGVGIASNLSWS